MTGSSSFRPAVTRDAEVKERAVAQVNSPPAAIRSLTTRTVRSPRVPSGRSSVPSRSETNSGRAAQEAKEVTARLYRPSTHQHRRSRRVVACRPQRAPALSDGTSGWNIWWLATEVGSRQCAVRGLGPRPRPAQRTHRFEHAMPADRLTTEPSVTGYRSVCETRSDDAW